jgi:hypothetical protein
MNTPSPTQQATVSSWVSDVFVATVFFALTNPSLRHLHVSFCSSWSNYQTQLQFIWYNRLDCKHHWQFVYNNFIRAVLAYQRRLLYVCPSTLQHHLALSVDAMVVHTVKRFLSAKHLDKLEFFIVSVIDQGTLPYLTVTSKRQWDVVFASILWNDCDIV